MKLTYFWINIDKTSDRREFMEKQFKEMSIDNKRISAITPEKLSTFLEDKPPFFCGYSECRDNKCKDCHIEYAVLCSHFEAIKAGYNSGTEYFIVCEDDVIFPFELDFSKIIERLPPSFDIIQFMNISAGHTSYFYENFYKKKVDFITYTPITPSAAFYLITRKGAEQLLKTYINKKTNKYDFKNCEYMRLADVLIFQSVFTFVSTFPFAIPNIQFKSQIHEHHFKAHKEATEMIISKIKEDERKNEFINHYYYPCEDLEKLFKS